MRLALALLTGLTTSPAFATGKCDPELKAALKLAAERATTAYMCRPALGDMDIVGSRIAIEDLLAVTGHSPDEATVETDGIMQEAETQAAAHDLSDIGNQLTAVCAKRTRQLQDQYRVAAAKLRLCGGRHD